MRRRRRRWLGIFVGVMVSLIAFGLALRWAGLEPLKQALMRVEYSYLGLAVVLYLISLASRAACWRTLLGHSFSFRRVFAALNQGYLLNNVLPWRMGEIGRAGYRQSTP